MKSWFDRDPFRNLYAEMENMLSRVRSGKTS